jgi:hypothetical protein
MGIQAPSGNQSSIMVMSALTSYNRPLIIALIFLATLVTTYFLSKKNISVSIVVSSVLVILIALYFIFSFTSAVRY